ncbi:MAG: hypothetical protein ACPGGA_05215 [Balneolaceae bacterium]
MSTKFKNLKNDLQDLEQEVDDTVMGTSTNSSSGNTKVANYILLFAFVATLLFYAGNRIENFFEGFQGIDNPISEQIQDAVQSLGEYDPELLQGMRDWMEDMGYGVLTDAELSALRDEGVTATQTQAFHDIGYQPTLEQLVELERADVSTTYASMMQELGYNLTVEDLAETRRNGVTAFFTSNMMDLGYTIDEMPVDELIGMRRVGVDHEMAQDLIEERRVKPTVDELKRYAISNQ